MSMRAHLREHLKPPVESLVGSAGAHGECQHAERDGGGEGWGRGGVAGGSKAAKGGGCLLYTSPSPRD
eukprot:2269091-Alexandrium_andersonii.AAC.1